MKDPEVCEGCKYSCQYRVYHELYKTCTYAEKTGHCRLKVERENGGYKKDKCPCYDAGDHEKKIVKPRLANR